MTPDEIIMERLTIELADSVYNGKTQAEAWEYLNATESVITETKLMPFTLAELLGFLSPESKAKLVDWQGLVDLKDSIKAQNHVDVVAWLAFITGTKITAEEYQTAHSHLARTYESQTIVPIQSRAFDMIRGIPSGPNIVPEDLFAAAWLAVGRT